LSHTHHLDKRADDLITTGANDPDDLLTTKQLAAWLGVSTTTLEIWRCEGKGPPFVRITPRMVRYRRGDVLQWLAERTLLRCRQSERAKGVNRLRPDFR
jgi:predicted DNA-binding transcriptional regulator AlpA